MDWHEKDRGTGKTTGLIISAIGKACIKPGRWIEFEDHYPHRCMAKIFAGMIRDRGKQMGLMLGVKTKDGQVFVKSTHIIARDIKSLAKNNGACC